MRSLTLVSFWSFLPWVAAIAQRGWFVLVIIGECDHEADPRVMQERDLPSISGSFRKLPLQHAREIVHYLRPV